jgi:hypothetical protein
MGTSWGSGAAFGLMMAECDDRTAAAPPDVSTTLASRDKQIEGFDSTPSPR